MTRADEDENRRLRQQQTALARFGRLALQSDDLEEILTEACHLVGEALDTDLAKVMELQRDGETLLVRAGVGWKPGVVGEVTIKVTANNSEGAALTSGKPMVSPDIEKETRFEYAAFLIDNGVKALANVPIIGGLYKPAFGILQVDSREPREFTESDTNFLSSYANLLAAAVDRLRVNSEVRNGEARLRLALDYGALGSWDLDLVKGYATRTPQYDQIFGYTGPLPAWSYESFLDYVVPEDRDRVGAMFRQAIEARSEWHFECRIRRAKDGRVRWIESRGGPDSDKNNRPGHLLGIAGDITERKCAEEVLLRSKEVLEALVLERTSELIEITRELMEANQRLQAAARERERVEDALRQSQKMEAVGQLTGGLAHDFNNLLGGISGCLELIKQRASQGRMENLGHYVETAMESANRAAGLIHRLLAFSRRQTLDPKATAVDTLVDGMAELFRRTVGPCIKIETSFAEGMWPTLCDPNQLKSALLNLVINARDAMPDGGQLLIETSNTVLLDRQGAQRSWPPQDVPPGEYVALSVADTGSGMTPDIIVHAFDPFFTTKPIGQGTGLGLSMIYGFVRQSGGHVRLRSELGQGTTVAIYLPRHVGAVDARQTASKNLVAPAARQGVVLIVEDDPNIRMVMLEVLSDLGYALIEAVDGPSGLRILESEIPIDLLLTDVGLPGGLNGRQLADAARSRRPGLKVLFVTGYVEGLAFGKLRMDPGMHVLTKPFALTALAEKVQSALEDHATELPIRHV